MIMQNIQQTMIRTTQPTITAVIMHLHVAVDTSHGAGAETQSNTMFPDIHLRTEVKITKKHIKQRIC